MGTINIYTTTLGFRVGVEPDGTLSNTNTYISEYARALQQWDFDSKSRRYEKVEDFYHYDETTKTAYFPRYDLERFISFICYYGHKENIIPVAPVKGDPAKFYMLPHITYKDELQKEAVEFITDEKNGPVRALAIQTGRGKTTATVMAMSHLGVRTMVTMTTRLEQWVPAIKQYAAVDDGEIYTIKGEPSLTKIIRMAERKDKLPKIILASAQTLKNYMKYKEGYRHLPNPSTFCELLGIGIIADDEYHEHFHTNFMMGLLFNAAVYIPVSATLVVNHKFIRGIFDKVVPQKVRFGGEYAKYVKVLECSMEFGGHLVKPHHYKQRGAYSQSKFEEFLLSEKGAPLMEMYWRKAILPLVTEQYIELAEEGEKLLIIANTRAMCEELQVRLKRITNRSIGIFVSGVSTTVLDKSDIILSTPGSAGTGRDVAMLRSCIVLENTASEARIIQFLGRLRMMKSGNIPVFVTCYFSCIPQHQRYATIRSMLYAERAKELIYRRLS
jgi:superfamily II DNA or RNA helicase